MKTENKSQLSDNRKILKYYFDGKEWCCKMEEELEMSDFVQTNILQESEQIRQRIHNGEVSPLAYCIHKYFSDNTATLFSGRAIGIDLLSSYTGIAKREIKKHLKQKYFCQLDETTLKKYAEAFDISIEELVNVL